MAAFVPNIAYSLSFVALVVGCLFPLSGNYDSLGRRYVPILWYVTYSLWSGWHRFTTAHFSICTRAGDGALEDLLTMLWENLTFFVAIRFVFDVVASRDLVWTWREVVTASFLCIPWEYVCAISCDLIWPNLLFLLIKVLLKAMTMGTNKTYDRPRDLVTVSIYFDAFVVPFGRQPSFSGLLLQCCTEA